MQHAGFDGLNNPQGVLLIFACLLLVTGIIIGGAFLFRSATRKDEEMRAEMRRVRDQEQADQSKSS